MKITLVNQKYYKTLQAILVYFLLGNCFGQKLIHEIPNIEEYREGYYSEMIYLEGKQDNKYNAILQFLNFRDGDRLCFTNYAIDSDEFGPLNCPEFTSSGESHYDLEVLYFQDSLMAFIGSNGNLSFVNNLNSGENMITDQIPTGNSVLINDTLFAWKAIKEYELFFYDQGELVMVEPEYSFDHALLYEDGEYVFLKEGFDSLDLLIGSSAYDKELIKTIDTEFTVRSLKKFKDKIFASVLFYFEEEDYGLISFDLQGNMEVLETSSDRFDIYFSDENYLIYTEEDFDGILKFYDGETIESLPNGFFIDRITEHQYLVRNRVDKEYFLIDPSAADINFVLDDQSVEAYELGGYFGTTEERMFFYGSHTDTSRADYIEKGLFSIDTDLEAHQLFDVGSSFEEGYDFWRFQIVESYILFDVHYPDGSTLIYKWDLSEPNDVSNIKRINEHPVYPNPTKGVFWIEEEVQDYRVIDLMGNVIAEGVAIDEGKTSKIILDQIPSGSYLIEFMEKSSKKRYTKKIVISE